MPPGIACWAAGARFRPGGDLYAGVPSDDTVARRPAVHPPPLTVPPRRRQRRPRSAGLPVTVTRLYELDLHESDRSRGSPALPLWVAARQPPPAAGIAAAAAAAAGPISVTPHWHRLRVSHGPVRVSDRL
jgi:hypothetical protein